MVDAIESVALLPPQLAKVTSSKRIVVMTTRNLVALVCMVFVGVFFMFFEVLPSIFGEFLRRRFAKLPHGAAALVTDVTLLVLPARILPDNSIW